MLVHSTWNKSTQLYNEFIGHAPYRHYYIRYLTGCSKIRTVSARFVLNMCIPMRLFTLEFTNCSSVSVLWTTLGTDRFTWSNNQFVSQWCQWRPDVKTSLLSFNKPATSQMITFRRLTSPHRRTHNTCSAFGSCLYVASKRVQVWITRYCNTAGSAALRLLHAKCYYQR